MAVKKLCGRCGEDALDRNPNCPACANRHARWCRAGDPRGIPTPRKNVCAACGQPAHQTNPNCKTCIKREQRRAKAEGREPYIPLMTTKAMAAPPVPVTTLTKARDVHNHEALTGWLTARRNRLNPTRKKEKEMTTHTTLTGVTITDEQLQALALELVNIQADIAVLKEEAAKIEATLKALPNGKYTCGDATLTVSHPADSTRRSSSPPTAPRRSRSSTRPCRRSTSRHSPPTSRTNTPTTPPHASPSANHP